MLDHPKILFKAGFIQDVERQLCVGSTIHIDYDVTRFQEEGAVLYTGEYEVPLWKITLYWEFNNSTSISSKELENIVPQGGQSYTTHSKGSITIPYNAISISLWFSFYCINVVTGEVEPEYWDSKFGENYNFNIEQC